MRVTGLDVSRTSLTSKTASSVRVVELGFDENPWTASRAA